MIICLPNDDIFGQFYKQPYDNIYTHTYIFIKFNKTSCYVSNNNIKEIK